MTPYRIAFYTTDDMTWITIDFFIDAFFFVDMVLNFFMAYYNDTDEIVDDRRMIANHYLKSWFVIDIATVIPISEIL